MIDSVTSATRGFAPTGVQPAASATPPSSPAPSPAPAAPSQSQTRSDAGGQMPSLALDFSQGLSGAYVLDWRDPSTGQVLVQIPMRTALQQGTPAAADAGQVGKNVDTEA